MFELDWIGLGIAEVLAVEVARRGDDKGFECISMDDELDEKDIASIDESRDEAKVDEEVLDIAGFIVTFIVSPL